MLTVDRHPKQAPGRRDMELRRLLAEILQGGQRALAGLDLIENDQRLPRNDTLPGGRLQIPQEALRLDILIEVRRNRQISFQIDIDDILELLLSEFAEDIGLSHLTSAVDNQRQAVGSLLFPGNQLFLDLALHIPHLTSTAYLYFAVKSRKICRFYIFLDL